jgi:hypothetical protein
MKRLFKSLVATTATVALAATIGASAFASAEMENMVFAGYDTTNPYAPNKIYNEVIDGMLTNKQVLVPVTPEWRFEAYEAAYPHAGYSTLYLEGNKQDKIVAYNNLFPQWDVRRSDYEWEIKRPHYVWERQQTKINNKDWTWDFGKEDSRGNAKFDISDDVLKTKTARTAVNVSYEMKNYGFGALNNQGHILSADEQEMYKAFGVDYAITTWNSLLENEFSWESLSRTDAYNKYVLSDEEIAALIPVVRSEYITAQFNEKGYGKETKNVAVEYLNKSAWEWDYDLSFDVVRTADVDWTVPTYESAEPYAQYQYLIVNGAVLDGKDGRPMVGRYTKGIATPDVEWRFAFFEKNLETPGIYEVIEQKYLDGVPAIENGSFVYRKPVGKFGKTYFRALESTIQYRVKDEDGHDMLLREIDKYEGNLGGDIDSYDTAPYSINVDIDADPSVE